MALRPDAWNRLISSDDGGLLLPILTVASPFFEPDADEDQASEELVTDEQRALLVELIPEAAMAIHQYCYKRRSEEPITARRGPRIGRNEPLSVWKWEEVQEVLQVRLSDDRLIARPARSSEMRTARLALLWPAAPRHAHATRITARFPLAGTRRYCERCAPRAFRAPE